MDIQGGSDQTGYGSGAGGGGVGGQGPGNLSVVGVINLPAGQLDNVTSVDGLSNESTTICYNDYCVSDEEYLDMIQAYIFPTYYEWIFIFLYLVTFIVGLVGNFLVCFAVWRNEHMHTVTNYFIVNLSVADFLVILICLPPTVLGDVTQTWFMGRIMCKIVHYLQGVSITVSVLTLTAISVERWYAICHPLSFKSTAKKVRFAIVSIWVTAMLLYVPEAVVLDTERLLPAELTDLLVVCRPTWSPQRQATYQLFLIIVLFFIPFGLMGFFYIAIAKCLWTNAVLTEPTNRPLNSAGRDTAARQLQSRRNVAKMLIAVVVMFGVCYLPVHVVNILRYFGIGLPDGELVTVIALVAHWLCYYNSAINPVIYNFMSAKFRKEFVRLCRCCAVVCGEGRRSRRSPYGDSTFNSYKYSYGNTMSQTEHVTLSTIKTHHGNQDCTDFSDE